MKKIVIKVGGVRHELTKAAAERLRDLLNAELYEVTAVGDDPQTSAWPTPLPKDQHLNYGGTS